MTDLNRLAPLEYDPGVVGRVSIVRQLELFQEVIHPSFESSLLHVVEGASHALGLLLGGLLKALLESLDGRLEQEWIELEEASELRVVASELAEDHGRVLEVLAEMLDPEILEAGEVEAVLERRDEQDVRLRP